MTPKSSYAAWAAIALWALACWLFFQLAYPAHFFFQEQNQLFLLAADYVATYRGTGWLARLAGDFLTQFYYYLYAGATILTLVLTATAIMLWLLLRSVRAPRWLAVSVAVVVVTLQALFHWRYDYPLSGSITLMGWVAALCVAVWLLKRAFARSSKAKSSRRSAPVAHLQTLVAVGVLALAVWLFGAPRVGRIHAPEWRLERLLAVDNAYRFAHYDRVVALVEQEQQPMPEMLFFYNLVMAQRGLLPDNLLRFVPNELGTLHKIGPQTPLYTIKNMNELYWLLGDMTYCERAAMMANVFSPTNRNVRMVKRLAEVSLVSGDTLAAQKYLRLLSQTVAYSRWARQAPTNPLYQQKRALTNTQDTLALGDNAHFIMMQLLQSNPANTVAIDYMLCTELLLKDMESFKRDYELYCPQGRVKRLYQEALCIYLAGTEAPPQEWQRLIVMPQVAQRFALYNSQRGSSQFSDTYWYYFDKAPLPQP